MEQCKTCNQKNCKKTIYGIARCTNCKHKTKHWFEEPCISCYEDMKCKYEDMEEVK